MAAALPICLLTRGATVRCFAPGAVQRGSGLRTGGARQHPNSHGLPTRFEQEDRARGESGRGRTSSGRRSASQVFRRPDVHPRGLDGVSMLWTNGWRRLGVWRPEYPVWAKRDGYIPAYTVGMVNTRYIPVFMEYSDPSTVSQSHRAPCRSQCGTHRRLSAD